LIVYRLRFDGALRTPSSGEVFPRSDTLHAALCASLAALGEDASAAAASPAFAVSSCFPFVRRRGGGLVHFLPAPAGVVWPTNDDGPAPRYVSPAIALDPALGAAGEVPAPAAPQALSAPSATGAAPLSVASGAAPSRAPRRFVAQDGQVWSDAPVGYRLWANESRARRPVDRVTGRALRLASTSSALRFVEGAGLYFIARFDTAAARAPFEAALAHLADEGFGRAAPFGVEADESPSLSDVSADLFLLSLYSPTEGEVRGGVFEGARWTFASRGGVTSQGLVRPSLRMVAEGARLRVAVNHAPRGQSVRLMAPSDAPRLGHAIYRSGRALCVSRESLLELVRPAPAAPANAPPEAVASGGAG
jgi:CRISPR/Cas system CSM-associated protein Csm4 (group 5 of RAMP superfamily)